MVFVVGSLFSAHGALHELQTLVQRLRAAKTLSLGSEIVQSHSGPSTRAIYSTSKQPPQLKAPP
eukprot:1516850-Amphidinium_carterae.1